MKKQLIAFATLLSASSLAFAVQPGGGTGIGVAQTNGDGVLGLDTQGSSIFVPMAVGNQGLWIEPSLTYMDVDTDGGDAEVWAFGIGVFQDLHVTEQTRFYGGARVAYLDAEIDGVGGTADADGWQFAPTVGFGYAPVDNILFGAEAFVSYTDIDDDGGVTGFGDPETTETGTALFARYYFDAR